MKKELLLKIGIGIIILVIIILVTIIMILNNNSNNNEVPSDIVMDEIKYTATYKISNVKNVADVMSVNNYVETYLNYVYEKNNKALYNISIDDYLKSNNITEENIINNVITLNNKCSYVSDSVYEFDNGLYLKTYIIFGNIIDETESQSRPYNFLVNLDITHMAIQIAPLDKVYNNYITITSNNNIKIDEEGLKEAISKIDSNDFNYANMEIGVEDKEVSEFYFKHYLINTLYNPEKAYNYLDEEYRIKRFGNIDNFKNYIENKKQVLYSAMMNKYLVKEKDNYRQYVILDNYGNYYIIKETNPMEYSVLLDYYTVDVDEFVEKFNTTNVSQKVALNVHKFIDMINYSDYNAAYNLLDENFRNNNFGNVNSFEQYLKNHFYEINKADLSNIEEHEDVYTIEAKIQNYTTYIENSNNYIAKTFIVKLNDDGTCKMSFNI